MDVQIYATYTALFIFAAQREPARYFEIRRFPTNNKYSEMTSYFNGRQTVEAGSNFNKLKTAAKNWRV